MSHTSHFVARYVLEEMSTRPPCAGHAPSMDDACLLPLHAPELSLPAIPLVLASLLALSSSSLALYAARAR